MNIALNYRLNILRGGRLPPVQVITGNQPGYEELDVPVRVEMTDTPDIVVTVPPYRRGQLRTVNVLRKTDLYHLSQQLQIKAIGEMGLVTVMINPINLKERGQSLNACLHRGMYLRIQA